MATAAIVRFTQQVTQRGISNAAWSAFYNVVPAERRAQVLAFNDGVPGQIGTILSGLLLLAAGTLLARDQVFWLGALTALVCTVVVLGIRVDMRASLLRTLRAGLGEQVLEGGPGPRRADRRSGRHRRTDRGAPGVRARRSAAWRPASSAGRPSNGQGPALIRAVDDDPDPSVRVAALEALASLGGPPPAAAAAEACLLDPNDRVREAAVRALSAVSDDLPATIEAMPCDRRAGPRPESRVSEPPSRACSLPATRTRVASRILEELLEAPDEHWRVAGLDAARRLGDAVPIDRLRPMMADPSPRVRAARGRCARRVDRHRCRDPGPPRRSRR